MASKKTKYFAKSHLVDGDKVIKIGEEISLTDAQAKRLLDADAISKNESEAGSEGSGGGSEE